MADAASQCDLLRKSAARGNPHAVVSLLKWTAPTVSSARQQAALAAINSLLLSADTEAHVSRVLADNEAGRMLAHLTSNGPQSAGKSGTAGPPSPSLAKLARAIVERLPAPPGAAGDDVGRATPDDVALQPVAKTYGSANADADEVFVDDAVMDWAVEQGYDEDEVYDFKEEWDEHEEQKDGGLPADQFVAFIVQQFGSIEAGFAERVATSAPGTTYSFGDFLRYMDQYESLTDSEGDLADGDYDDDDDYADDTYNRSQPVDDDDSFYLGTATSEPHATLRQFLVAGADHAQLTHQLEPSAADFAAVFNDDVAESVRARLDRVRDAQLSQPIRPVHVGQRVVGVYDIEDEYRELWSQVGSLIRPGVRIFGFDFNSGTRFSARGSATFAFLARSADGQSWRYFPARWIVMSDAEFARRQNPELREVRELADRIMKNEDVPGIGAQLRPTEADWLALFPGNAELARAAHTLYEQSVSPSPDGHQRAWNIGPVVALNYGVAAYYRYEIVSAKAADFQDSESNNFARRMTGRLPQTYRLIAPYVPDVTLAGLTLTYGLMRAPDPNRPVPQRYQNPRYEYYEGDFAPNKTFSLLAKVNGHWRFFPRKIIFAALGEQTNAETSTSEPEFWDSSESEGSSDGTGDDRYSDEGSFSSDGSYYSDEDRPRSAPDRHRDRDVEGGGGFGRPPTEEEGWLCSIQ